LNGLLNQASHIPYWDSKLTHYLKESLGGDSKTLLLIQVSPNPDDIPETISTLTFGSWVSKIEKGPTKIQMKKVKA